MVDYDPLNKPHQLYNSRKTFSLIQTTKDNVGFLSYLIQSGSIDSLYLLSAFYVT